MSSVESKLLKACAGVRHGFGTRAEPVPEPFANGFQTLRAQRSQVHGVALGRLSRAGENVGEVDAIVTAVPGLFADVATADCVPILLARKDASQVVAVHAGWRGTVAKIVRSVWGALGESSPQNWIAAIGPAAGRCCYEVSLDVVAQFRSAFPDAKDIITGERHLDLKRINALELHSLGIQEVDILPYCTLCDDRFHSYRREGGGTRQYSAIGLRI